MTTSLPHLIWDNAKMWRASKVVATMPPGGLLPPGTSKLCSKGHTGSEGIPGARDSQQGKAFYLQINQITQHKEN